MQHNCQLHRYYFLTTNFLKVSQYFTEKGVGRVPHGSPLWTPMFLTGREQRDQRNNICYRSGSLFKESFRNFQLKKVNGTRLFG